MRALYLGVKNPDVKLWQLFLRGLSEESELIVTGEFDEYTQQATIEFQSSRGLVADGIVGPQTISEALKLGFAAVKDDSKIVTGPNWPPRPTVPALSPAERAKIFGKFSFTAAPSRLNPEGIKITDDWTEKNIIRVEVEALKNVAGSSKTGTVLLHRAISRQFIKLFDDWNNAGLSEKILTWGGMWVPRFVRGSRTTLSNHSWGTAFDINVPWNGLGVQPALKDEKGSVRDLVEIAYSNGFYWGGWFRSRPDGMHFEAFKVIE